MKFRQETLVHRVILKPAIVKKTESGIIVASSDRMQATNSDRGEVVMIGPEAWKDFGCKKPPVKVGDKVVFSKYGAKILKFKEDDEIYLIVNDEDILVGYKDD